MRILAATVILFCSVLALSSGTWTEKNVTKKLSDTVSVNTCKLRFRTETGRPVDFKMGMNAASPVNIHVSVDIPYIVEKLDVMLVRGKRPVSFFTYANKQEVVIEKTIFTNAQPGDRFCIDVVEVVKEVNGIKTPVELDVPVFNIPLN